MCMGVNRDYKQKSQANEKTGFLYHHWIWVSFNAKVKLERHSKYCGLYSTYKDIHMYKRQGSHSYQDPIEKGMTEVNTQNETMTNSVKLPRLLYGLWQFPWALPVHLLLRNSTETGKYLSGTIPGIPTLHTVFRDEFQSNKMYPASLIRWIRSFQSGAPSLYSQHSYDKLAWHRRIV